MFKNFKFSLPKIGKIPFLNLEMDLQSKFTFWIIFALAAGVELYLAIAGHAGRFGSIAGTFLRTGLGRMAFVIPLGFFVSAIFLIRIQRRSYLAQEINGRFIWGILLMVWALCGYLNLFNWVDYGTPDKNDFGGGFVGYLIYPLMLGFFGNVGGFFMLFFVFLFGFFLFSQLTTYDFLEKAAELPDNPRIFWDFIPDIVEFWKTQTTLPEVPKLLGNIEVPIISPNVKPIKDTGNETKPIFETNEVKQAESKPENVKNHERPVTAGGEKFAWKLPNFNILQESTSNMDAGDIGGKKLIIKNTLSSFGIEVEMKEVVVGPTVSQYTLKPASGVKLSAIDSLQQNLALELAASSVRIESPIAGKSLVGVEIPNRVKSQVRLRNLLQTKEFLESKDDLPIPIGLDVAGRNMLYSVAKMPHLLVAGSTGSGKSVWINNLLVSLLFKYSPQDLQLILVDMKKVELKPYDGIPHLLSKVITDAEKAINALKWTVLEMEKRYNLLEEWGKRNIRDFNAFVKQKADPELHEMPYIVFVIDELGDLMMIAKNEVEPIIVRLTAMSRAVGIHLVLGTQRPDTGVVTGLIKANIPSRIAFAVASQIDSRVIIDQGGAEKLLGQGDGLFMSPSNMKAIRFQGAYVDDKEIMECIQYIKDQTGDSIYLYNLNPNITEPQRAKINVPGMRTSDNDFEESLVDDMYEKVKEFAFTKGFVSTSSLQTALGIGYPRARKFIQMMEEDGMCGPSNGSKPREVFPPEDWEV